MRLPAAFFPRATIGCSPRAIRSRTISRPPDRTLLTASCPESPYSRTFHSGTSAIQRPSVSRPSPSVSFIATALALMQNLRFCRQAIQRSSRVEPCCVPRMAQIPEPPCHTTTRRPRYLTNGWKALSSCSNSYPLSMHRVAITVSMVLRTVTPALRSARKFLAA